MTISASKWVTCAENRIGRPTTTMICTLDTHTHTHLTALCLGLRRWAGTRKVKPTWILLKQETVSGSEIRWAICKSASCSRQITTPAPHRSVFYRPDALPAAQPTASKHWRHIRHTVTHIITWQKQHSPSLKGFAAGQVTQQTTNTRQPSTQNCR